MKTWTRSWLRLLESAFLYIQTAWPWPRLLEFSHQWRTHPHLFKWMQNYSELVGAGQGGWCACSKHNNSHQRPMPTSWCPFLGPVVKVSLWRFGKGSAFIVTYLQSHQEDILGGNVTLCFFFFEEIEVKEEDVRRQWEKSECKNMSKCVRVSVRWRLERCLFPGEVPSRPHFCLYSAASACSLADGGEGIMFALTALQLKSCLTVESISLQWEYWCTSAI